MIIIMDQERAYRPIDDYGLIGNCYTAALISSRGSLDWLCMPSFDSSSIFASILDIERGGSWSIHPTASCRSEHRYLEYTNVLETIFVCDDGRVRLLDFMPVSSEVAGGTVTPPIAVIRIIEGLNGEVEIESLCQPRPGYGLSFPTFEAQGTRVAFDSYTITGPDDWRVLGLCIQPDEGVHLRFEAKVPGGGNKMRPVDMEFHYANAFGQEDVPDAYERLLLDAMHGDASLPIRSDTIELSWALIDPILASWEDGDAPPLSPYEVGSWGPVEADELLARDGRSWLRACGGHDGTNATNAVAPGRPVPGSSKVAAWTGRLA